MVSAGSAQRLARDHPRTRTDTGPCPVPPTASPRLSRRRRQPALSIGSQLPGRQIRSLPDLPERATAARQLRNKRHPPGRPPAHAVPRHPGPDTPSSYEEQQLPCQAPGGRSAGGTRVRDSPTEGTCYRNCPPHDPCLTSGVATRPNRVESLSIPSQRGLQGSPRCAVPEAVRHRSLLAGPGPGRTPGRPQLRVPPGHTYPFRRLCVLLCVPAAPRTWGRPLRFRRFAWSEGPWWSRLSESNR